MGKALYFAGLAVILAMLILGVRTTAAQTPKQGGGYLTGSVYGFDMYDELIPLEWVSVTAANANYKFVTSTGSGGAYEMFLPLGAYNLTVNTPGYKPYSRSIFVGEGSATSINVYLYESGIPVPEFPTQAVSLIIAFAVAAALLTKVRKHKR